MSDSPLSPPVALNIVGLNVNVNLHTAAQAAAYLNDNSTTSSSEESPSMDANYNSRDSGAAAGVNLQYPPTSQVRVKQPTLSSTSSSSEGEGDALTDSVDNAAASAPNNGASSSNVTTSGSSTGRSVSPPPNCAICLGRCKNKCYTDSCMHQFCFKCLCEWSKVKPECPLCKQTFSSIIHNVKSDNQFEEYHVQPPTVQIPQRPFERLPVPFIVDVINGHNLRSNSEWNSWRIAASEVAYGGLYVSSNDEVPGRSDEEPPQLPGNIATRAEFLRLVPENISLGDPTHQWRRYVYDRKLFALPVCDITGRFRESSARFYRENPAQMYRLLPWINREIYCLFSNVATVPTQLLPAINDSLIVMNILSPSFRRMVQGFLGAKTAHFIHELNNFARSPFDIIGYDRNVQYARQVPEQIVIDFSTSGSSDDESRRRTIEELRRVNRPTSGTTIYRFSSDPNSLVPDGAPRQPIVNMVAFTISTTSEGEEASGISAAPVNGSGTVSQPTAMNLTTHNRTSSEIINLDGVEFVSPDEALMVEIHANSTDRLANANGSNGSSSSTSLSQRTSSAPVENIELNTSSSSDECEFVLERKAPHLRTPEMVSLNSDSEDSDVVFIDEQKPPALLVYVPPLEQASFSSTDDEVTEIARRDAIAYCTRRRTAAKYEDRFNTGASTSRGLRAAAHSHSEVAEAVHGEQAPSTSKRQTQRGRQRAVRSTAAYNKSKRHWADSKSSSSSECDSSSSAETPDLRIAGKPDFYVTHKRRKAAASHGKRKGTVEGGDAARGGGAGPPAKRLRRKSKRIRKAPKVVDAHANVPYSSEAASELYNASESSSDDEEYEVLEAIRKRLRHDTSTESGNSPDVRPQEDQQRGQDATSAPIRRNESLNLTNAIRKIKHSLRTTSQNEQTTADAEGQAQAQDGMSSEAGPSEVTNSSAAKQPPQTPKRKRAASSNAENTLYSLARVLTSLSEPVASIPEAEDDFYPSEQNILDEFDRLLGSEAEQAESTDKTPKVQSTLSKQNSDMQCSDDFTDTPSTSRGAARAATTSTNSSSSSSAIAAATGTAPPEKSVFRDTVEALNDAGEALLNDKPNQWLTADAHSRDNLSNNTADDITEALRDTVQSLVGVNVDLLKSEPDNDDDDSGPFHNAYWDNNTNDTNDEEVEGNGSDAPNVQSDDDVDVVSDDKDSESSSSTGSESLNVTQSSRSNSDL